MSVSTARSKPSLKLSRVGPAIGLAVVLTLAGSDGLQDAVANGDTRTLSLYHLHTRESLTVTFKRNGEFDAAGLNKLNHFLRDWRNDQQIKMDPRLFDIVWQVYQDTGAARPIEIISAYRSPATNSMLRRRSRGVAKASQHMLGKAMDFHIPGVPLERVRNAGLRLQRGGVGYYPSSGSPFVHVDVGSVRHWPRLSPEALARVFPDGRTVHIPSNGRPLPGYALALADVARRGASPSAVSVAAAEQAGVPAAASSSSSGNWLSRLFRGGETKPAEETPAPARERVREPVRVAAVPLPRNRPAAAQAPATTTVLAAAAALQPVTPAQIIEARGVWNGAAMAAADTPMATGSTGQRSRIVWRIGPQPAQARVASSERVPTPPSRPVERVVAAADETTANVPWPTGAREDAVPKDMALAYASTVTFSPEPSATRAPPMGNLRSTPARTTLPLPAGSATRSARRAPSHRTPAPSRDAGNPWLRGIMLTSSMQRAVAVSLIGSSNYLQLTPLMHKPGASIANSFANNPEFGLNSQFFQGRAVAFLPMIDFRRLTVGLN